MYMIYFRTYDFKNTSALKFSWGLYNKPCLWFGGTQDMCVYHYVITCRCSLNTSKEDKSTFSVFGLVLTVFLDKNNGMSVFCGFYFQKQYLKKDIAKKLCSIKPIVN